MANEKKDKFSCENIRSKLNEYGINSATMKAHSETFFKASMEQMDKQNQVHPQKTIEDNIMAHTGLDL